MKNTVQVREKHSTKPASAQTQIEAPAFSIPIPDQDELRHAVIQSNALNQLLLSAAKGPDEGSLWGDETLFGFSLLAQHTNTRLELAANSILSQLNSATRKPREMAPKGE
jgi:hypothetical protein